MSGIDSGVTHENSGAPVGGSSTPHRCMDCLVGNCAHSPFHTYVIILGSVMMEQVKEDMCDG